MHEVLFRFCFFVFGKGGGGGGGLYQCVELKRTTRVVYGGAGGGGGGVSVGRGTGRKGWWG